jgi:hypothetical protein
MVVGLTLGDANRREEFRSCFLRRRAHVVYFLGKGHPVKIMYLMYMTFVSRINDLQTLKRVFGFCPWAGQRFDVIPEALKRAENGMVSLMGSGDRTRRRPTP